jgi:hypothetical protein
MLQNVALVIALGSALLAAFQFGKWRGKKRAEWEARPMRMLHVFGCDCGTDTKCTREDVAPGAVLKCPNCSQVWGHLTPRGQRVWIKITDPTVKASSQSAGSERAVAIGP